MQDFADGGFTAAWCLVRVACAVGPDLEELLLSRVGEAGDTLRAILNRVACPLSLAAEFVPKMPVMTSDVLDPALPGGVRNGTASSVNLLFLGGHLGDATARSPALARLVDCLCLDSKDVNRAALTNVTGCGKTKTALDLLQVGRSLAAKRGR